MKKKLTSKQILELPEKEFIEYMNEVGKQRFSQRNEDVLPKGYQLKDIDKKVSYWAGILNNSMRTQAEAGHDPYAKYCSEWYESTINIEPEFDSIFEKVISYFEKNNFGWSESEIRKRILNKKYF